MRVTRRVMLKGSALAGAVVAAPAMAAVTQRQPLLVFDSGIPESAAFAATHPSLRGLDLAHGTVQAARALDCGGAVTGLTRWSDWVALRMVMESQGLRLLEEVRVASPLSGRAHLFRWAMAPR